MKYNRLLIIFLIATHLTACGTPEVSNKQAELTAASENTKINPIWPKLDIIIKSEQAVEEKVANILKEMTVEQKVAQMIQPEIRDVTVEDMRKYGFGAYLNGGGSYPNGNKQSTTADWVDLAEQMYQASIDDTLDGSTIPTMWGTDAVHGHNNVVGATLFPHNIGLGAANDPELIERIAKITATEVLVTGIDWIFAPTVATVRNDRWGRTYEGYSEDPDIVLDYSAAIVKGLQGQGDSFMTEEKVISNVKHFVGDGGTTDGIDQGNTVLDDETLFKIHSQGYVGGLSAGSQVVMASFNRWNGKKIHGSKYLLTHVLKDKMGFDGFVVGDWNGHGQVAGCSNESCPQSINAGLDMFMAPTQSWKPLFKNTVQQIKDGIIPISRIDDAVTRILRVKVRAGLFDKPSPARRKLSGKTKLLGSPEHRAVAREAVRKSLVLLKNQDNLLPLSPKQNILVAGDGADNIGKQSGGWSITWQGTNNENSDFPGGSSIWDGISEKVTAAGGSATLSVDGSFTEKPDVAVVVFGEDPYAEGVGDIPTLEYSPGNKKDLALLQSFQSQNIPVVALFITGRPLWINPELNASDAFVAIWLPGSEGVGIADVIMKDETDAIQHDFHGKLSFSWPRDPNQIVNIGDKNYNPLFPYGFGLTYKDIDTLGDNLSEVITTKIQDKPLIFFERSTQAPWELTLVSAFNTVEVNSNSIAIGDVQYRTEDRVVQEDAFRIITKGGSWAGIKFKGNGQAKDFSKLMSHNNQFSMLVNVKEQPTEDVLVGLNCGTVDSCKSVINIRKQLTTMPKDSWNILSIDAKCWIDKGVSFATLNEGLSIVSAGKMTASFSSIGFVKPVTDSTIRCP